LLHGFEIKLKKGTIVVSFSSAEKQPLQNIQNKLSLKSLNTQIFVKPTFENFNQ